MTKVFIDGKDGTTGLKIYSRMKMRDDIELLTINESKRKDPDERAKLINMSDITFLCLPDSAAQEAVKLAASDRVKIIDTSTAHRTNSGWAYGFAELSDEHRRNIAVSNRIAVPGCYAGGLISIAYPLIQAGIMPPDYPAVCYAVSGYTGAGKKGIAQYEDANRDSELDSPRQYALGQNHKHLKEMTLISGFKREPIFAPHICDYQCGMVVSLPVFTQLLNKKMSKKNLWEFFADYYHDAKLLSVSDYESESQMIGANNFAGRDDMQITISGNDDRVIITSRFDNLGKGASGAAMQCMNIALGIEETISLNIGE